MTDPDVMGELTDAEADSRWPEGWERHACPYFADRRMATHSLRFHRDDRSDARCAFDRCQAGGIILERAQRVVRQLYRGVDSYHPGCWAAYLNEPPF